MLKPPTPPPTSPTTFAIAIFWAANLASPTRNMMKIIYKIITNVVLKEELNKK